MKDILITSKSNINLIKPINNYFVCIYHAENFNRNIYN